jgi:hypothetical protein
VHYSQTTTEQSASIQEFGCQLSLTAHCTHFDLVAIGRSLIVNPTWPQIIQPGAIDELLPYQRDVLAQLI